MKQNYKMMAGAVLSGVVLIAVLAILSGTTLLPKLGEHMDHTSENYSSYQDSEQTKMICDRKVPEIIRKNSSIWKPGEEIRISEVFEGTDADGKQTEMKVLDIQDREGNSRMEDCYWEKEQKAVFSERGMYLIELKTTDQQKKSADKRFILLIDDRQGGI
ncbi:MAG: hypothetical protein HFH41_03800 [Lachnospiraceae bacterium]|nr:hypothetical protein [Lachnospiraceae bacterium]